MDVVSNKWVNTCKALRKMPGTSKYHIYILAKIHILTPHTLCQRLENKIWVKEGSWQTRIWELVSQRADI